MAIYSKIIATGSYLPKNILTNHQLEQLVDTSDSWITSRTGIKERRIIGNTELSSDMALQASNDAIQSANIDKQTIEMIIVATISSDVIFPSTACNLQKKLGLSNIPAFDLNAACSGFLYALTTADAYIRSGLAKTILVVGSDAISRYVNYTDRNTCILFGDGAGAVILQATNEPGIIATEIHADGNGEEFLYAKGPAKNNHPVRNPFIIMEGKHVFKTAVKNLVEVSNSLLSKSGYAKEQLDWLVPHQANIRIIESIATHLGLSMDKVITTIKYHGNTSAASVPLALDYACKSGKIQRGNLMLLEGFGAGYTWGGTLIRY